MARSRPEPYHNVSRRNLESAWRTFRPTLLARGMLSGRPRADRRRGGQETILGGHPRRAPGPGGLDLLDALGIFPNRTSENPVHAPTHPVGRTTFGAGSFQFWKTRSAGSPKSRKHPGWTVYHFVYLYDREFKLGSVSRLFEPKENPLI